MYRRLVSVLCVLLLVATVAAPPVAAEDGEDDFFADLAGDDDDDSVLPSTRDVALFVAGITGGIARLDVPFVGDEPTGNATTHAQGFTDAFNDNNETIESYANDRLTASTAYDTFVVHFTDDEGGNVSRYVVADVANGTYRDARVLTPSEFDATNRTVDHYVAADPYVSRHAAAEVETFVEDYAEPNETVPSSQRAAWLAEYGSGLESGMWNANTS
jgi:hypothetical protein